MKAAVIRALAQTREGLQSLKGSPRYRNTTFKSCSLTKSALTLIEPCRDLYIVYAINACDNFNYFSLSLLFTLYLTEEFGFSDQEVQATQH